MNGCILFYNKKPVRLVWCICVFALLFCMARMGPAKAANIEPEDNSSYLLPEENEAEEEEDEDLEGKIVIAVRRPVDFRVHSKIEGVFVVEAKHKGEIDGYDIRVQKTDSDEAKIYRAITTQNLFRRFVGAKGDDRYKIKVRTFRTVAGKDYPSRWTKELQVIVWPRSEDNTPSSTRLHELGRDKTESTASPAASDKKKKKNKNKKE